MYTTYISCKVVYTLNIVKRISSITIVSMLARRAFNSSESSTVGAHIGVLCPLHSHTLSSFAHHKRPIILLWLYLHTRGSRRPRLGANALCRVYYITWRVVDCCVYYSILSFYFLFYFSLIPRACEISTNKVQKTNSCT